MHRAFTLIELLVVVTIIVVLLALLTPALDKAVYQAELATCGANLKGIGSGSLVYAAGNRRFYPYRPTTHLGNTESPVVVWNGTRDDRGYLRRFLSLNTMLIDPLCQTVDLDHPVQSSNYVYSSYSLMWGWDWFNGASHGRRMRKLGDRFGLPDEPGKYSLLALDWDRVSNGFSTGSHPDNAHASNNQTYQGYSLTGDTPAAAQALAGGSGAIYTMSFWFAAVAQRGTLDRNFAYDDGSVLRLNGLTIDAQTSVPDERLEAVPTRNDLGNSANLRFKDFIPRQ